MMDAAEYNRVMDWLILFGGLCVAVFAFFVSLGLFLSRPPRASRRHPH